MNTNPQCHGGSYRFLWRPVYTDEPYNVTRALLLMVILTATRSGEARECAGLKLIFISGYGLYLQKEWKLATASCSFIPAGYLHSGKYTWPAWWTGVPSPRKQQILSDMVLTSFLRKKKAVSDIPGRVATAHGFRSTFRTGVANRGIRGIWRKGPAHTLKNKVEAAYHRTDLLEQRVHRWCRHGRIMWCLKLWINNSEKCILYDHDLICDRSSSN